MVLWICILYLITFPPTYIHILRTCAIMLNAVRVYRNFTNLSIIIIAKFVLIIVFHILIVRFLYILFLGGAEPFGRSHSVFKSSNQGTTPNIYYTNLLSSIYLAKVCDVVMSCMKKLLCMKKKMITDYRIVNILIYPRK